MLRYKVISSIIIPIIILLITTSTASEETAQSLTISIDSGGIVYVNFYADLKQGVNTFKLSVDPIAETINIKCDDEMLPWVLTDVTLNIVSDSECRALIEYLAKIYINGSTLSFDIKDDVMVKLAIEKNIILLSIPEDIESFSTDGNRLIIIFRGPATITYALSITANATATTTSPAEKVQYFPILVLIGIAIAITIAIAVLVFILRRR